MNGGTLTAVAGPYPVTFTHVPASPGAFAPPGGGLTGPYSDRGGQSRIKV